MSLRHRHQMVEKKAVWEKQLSDEGHEMLVPKEKEEKEDWDEKVEDWEKQIEDAKKVAQQDMIGKTHLVKVGRNCRTEDTEDEKDDTEDEKDDEKDEEEEEVLTGWRAEDVQPTAKSTDIKAAKKLRQGIANYEAILMKGGRHHYACRCVDCKTHQEKLFELRQLKNESHLRKIVCWFGFDV